MPTCAACFSCYKGSITETENATPLTPVRVVHLEPESLSAMAGIPLAAFEGYMSSHLGKYYVMLFLEWLMLARMGSH